MNLTELLNELVDRMGQGTLADQCGMDDSTLSRFRSGNGSISLRHLEKIFEVANVVVISRSRLRKIEDALEVVTDLWKEERRKNTGNRAGGTRKSDGT